MAQAEQQTDTGCSREQRRILKAETPIHELLSATGIAMAVNVMNIPDNQVRTQLMTNQALVGNRKYQFDEGLRKSPCSVQHQRRSSSFTHCTALNMARWAFVAIVLPPVD